MIMHLLLASLTITKVCNHNAKSSSKKCNTAIAICEEVVVTR